MVKKKEEIKFSKKELLTSSNINYGKDAINAILKDEGQYTVAEANALIKKFMEGGN